MILTISSGICMAPATGRRVICPVCGGNVGEVGPSPGAQVAHHELPPWNGLPYSSRPCPGSFKSSCHLPGAS